MRCVAFELVPLRVEKNSSHAHKTGSWKVLGILFKISKEQSVLLPRLQARSHGLSSYHPLGRETLGTRLPKLLPMQLL